MEKLLISFAFYFVLTSIIFFIKIVKVKKIGNIYFKTYSLKIDESLKRTLFCSLLIFFIISISIFLLDYYYILLLFLVLLFFSLITPRNIYLGESGILINTKCVFSTLDVKYI